MKIDHLFLCEEHMKRFNTLLILDSTSSDNERNALFFAISGNDELWDNAQRIYDVEKHVIKSKSINKLPLSSSAKSILLAGLNLYNSYKCYPLIDLFCNLDSDNFRLLLNIIRIRFPYK